jgi:hypothetical protein
MAAFIASGFLMEGAVKILARKSTEPEMDDLTGRRCHGTLTRRSALLALSATMLSPSLMAQQTRTVIRTRRLNNVTIAVSDLARSTAFYERRQSEKPVPSYFPSARGPTSLL